MITGALVLAHFAQGGATEQDQRFVVVGLRVALGSCEMVGQIDSFSVSVTVVGRFRRGDTQSLRKDSSEVLNTAAMPKKLDVTYFFFETFGFSVTVYFENLADFYTRVGFFHVFFHHQIRLAFYF
jgi:hypothetical protein